MAVNDRTIRNVFIYAAPKFATYGLNLLTLPILTRLLTPEEFGVATLAWIAPTIIVALASLGISSAAQRYYFEYRADPEKVDRMLFTGQAWLAVSLGLATCLVWPLQDQLARLLMGSSAYGAALFVAFLSSAISEFVNFYQLQFQNLERAGSHSVLTVTKASIQALGGVLFVWAFDAGYMGMLYGMLAGSVVSAAIGFAGVNRGRARRFDVGILKQNLGYGIQLVPKAFTGYINRYFDKYMLQSMLSMSAVGVYNIGQTVGNAMNSIMITVWNAFQPVFYREVFDDPAEGGRVSGRLFTFFAYLVIAPCIVVVLFAPEIVRLLAPPSYGEAVGIIVLATAAITTQAFGMFVGVQYAYTKRAWLIFPISVFGTVVNVAANVVLIPRLGLIGAGYATVLTYVALNAALSIVGQRLYRVGYQYGRLAAIYAVVFVGAAFTLWATAASAPWYLTFGVKLVVLGAYALVGVASGVLSKASVARVLSALRPGGSRAPEVAEDEESEGQVLS